MALFYIGIAVLTVLYLFRVFNLIFLGESKGTLAKEKSSVMVGVVAVLAILSLAGGLFIYYPGNAVQIITAQMLGAIK
jgi:NADH:ubiquinone oxidoreductase subunit 5 (subunit L)/multisubunit Na+/H+ antiporter MnhA subunit